MKYCSKCRTGFAEELERCPQDGEVLREDLSGRDGPEATRAAADPIPREGVRDSPRAGDPFLVSTQSLSKGTNGGGSRAVTTRDLADLVFKTCGRCQSVFGGDLEVCPDDGERLVEQSMLDRETLFFAEEGLTEAALQLRKYCPGCKEHFPLHETTCSRCGSRLVIPTLRGGAVQQSAPRGAGGQLGELIAGKYRVIRDIGTGGFGSIYLAKHEALGKRYAVKVLRGKFCDQAAFRDRFHEEALKLSRLEDENIVQVIDFGEWDDFQYMVTEYVQGEELTSVIYRDSVSPLRAARIMRQVAGALGEAHAKKIVHLDLKPANILITQRRGRDLVKVIDFGIAEIYSETRASRQKSVSGTCTYMAPEQWRREPFDPRSDIYSFGVIFYEMLGMRPPFRHHSVSDLERAHCKLPPPPLRKIRPDVPAELEKLIHRCLEKDPAERVQSAEALEAALNGWLRRTEDTLYRWFRRAVVGVALLAILAGAGYGGYQAWIELFWRKPLVLTAEVKPEDGQIRSLGPGEWLSRNEKIPLEVDIEEAAARLTPPIELRYRLDAEDAQASVWEVEDLRQGRKTFYVTLPRDGRHEISIEPLIDYYQNRSDPRRLVVHLDQSPPAIEDLPEAVEYYRAELPAVRFRLTDQHPDPAEESIQLLELPGGKPVDRRRFSLKGLAGGAWSLAFLDPALFPTDGRYRFQITAADQAGNLRADLGKFVVLADHSPPAIEAWTPEEGRRFQSHETISLMARVSDQLPEGMSVVARIAVEAPGLKYETALDLKLDSLEGVWTGAIAMAKGKGSDHPSQPPPAGGGVYPPRLARPQVFQDPEPGFTVTFLARDQAGNESRQSRRYHYRWENGDQLLWQKDGSVLVYHDGCQFQDSSGAQRVEPFWIAKTEVSNRQWALFLKDQGGRYDLSRREYWDAEAAAMLAGAAWPRSPEWSDGRCPDEKLDLPVRGVTWDEALAYARWAGLELPARSQWLVAALWDHDRNEARRFPWSENLPPERPLPIWAKKANPGPVRADEGADGLDAGRTPLGLEHLYGNVWEIVRDGRTGQYVKVGGGYDTSESTFRQPSQLDYLRGEPGRGGHPVERGKWNPNLGFRCVREGKR